MMPFLNEEVVSNTVRMELQPILEEWAKVELNPEFIGYGIRRYKRGAQLLLHTDRLETHIISAILQVRRTYILK